MIKYRLITGFAAATVLLVACGGSSSDSMDSTKQGAIRLGITDAPVDSAERVVVQFTGVELVPAEGSGADETASDDDSGNESDGTDAESEAEDMSDSSSTILFEFEQARSIDLLNLQGSTRELLLDGETIPAGNYAQIRLLVQAEEDGVFDSFIEIDGAQNELFIPSGAQTGLKLVRDFTVDESITSDFTIDFDLRKSVVFAPGRGYILKPVLRLVATQQTGTVAGIIDPAVFDGQACSALPEDGYAVYAYAGADVAADDLGSAIEPVTSSGVALNDDSQFAYELGFLEAGTYTLAATCTADADDVEADDDIAFVGAANVTVTAGAVVTQNFQ